MLTLLLATLPLLPSTAQEGAPAATAPVAATAREVLARPLVLGASMSTGFGLNGELAFADVLAKSLRLEQAPEELASDMFFLNPLEAGSTQGDLGLDHEPTVVFAVDYLFWFGYGTMNASGGPLVEEEERLELLEVGLDALSQFECPVVVGDFPNMADAVGRMLAESQVPEAASLSKLTARVREWASEREHTLVVPLAEFVEALGSDEAFVAGRFRIPAGARRRLLQRDELHPTKAGLCLMGHVVTEALIEAQLVPAAAVERDLVRLLEAFELDASGVERVPAEPAAEGAAGFDSDG